MLNSTYLHSHLVVRFGSILIQFFRVLETNSMAPKGKAKAKAKAAAADDSTLSFFSTVYIFLKSIIFHVRFESSFKRATGCIQEASL